VGPAANHIQRPWNILSAFQAALGGASQIVKGFTSISFHGGTPIDATFVFYFYCCGGMAVALLKFFS
jgi:hypothetical protein